MSKMIEKFGIVAVAGLWIASTGVVSAQDTDYHGDTPPQEVTAEPTRQAEPAPGDQEVGDATPAPTLDTDQDGDPDAWDRDGDGRADVWDLDGDGMPDALDKDGDGEPEVFRPGFDRLEQVSPPVTEEPDGR